MEVDLLPHPHLKFKEKRSLIKYRRSHKGKAMEIMKEKNPTQAMQGPKMILVFFVYKFTDAIKLTFLSLQITQL